MNAFTIKDLANLSGIKAHTLRIWEQRYNFLKPSRTFTNIRYYSNEELKTVLNIALLTRHGFRVSHIDRMSHAEMQERILSLNSAEAQQERIVNELIKSMVDADMETFERTIDNYISQRTVEKTMLQILFPFLHKIGILWQSNHVNPAQEHLVSNIVRQKVIRGIDDLKLAGNNSLSFLLFLPEGEHHELGLLFVHYLLRRKGVRVWYVGANIPLKDLEFLVNLKKPDYLYTHLTTGGHNFNMERFLNFAQLKFPNIPFILSGSLSQSHDKKVKAPIAIKRSLAEVMTFIEEL